MIRRLLPALLLTSPAFAAEQVLDRIAAIVDGEVISLSDVYALGGQFIEEQCPSSSTACRQSAERDVLDALIQRTLQHQALRDLQADVGPTEIDGAIDSVIRDNDFPDRQALRAEVERSGLAWEDYREELRAQLREMRFNEMVLRNRVTIPEDEIRDAYRRLVQDVEPPIVLELSAAASRLPDDAATWPAVVQEARAAIEAVRDDTLTWSSLVQTWDGLGLAPVFAARTFKEGDLADALSAAVSTVPAGEVAEPVIASGVLYLLRVDARGEGEAEVAPFEKARPQLEQKLFEERMADTLAEWEVRARKDASIRILLAREAEAEASAAASSEPVD